MKRCGLFVAAFVPTATACALLSCADTQSTQDGQVPAMNTGVTPSPQSTTERGYGMRGLEEYDAGLLK